MLATLAEVLKYENENVVGRFSEDYGVSFEDAGEIFTEAKRWLWFSAKQTLEVESGKTDFVAVPLFNEAKAIDLMWHTFLLYTQDYMNFCEKYFGFYLHHQPRPRQDRLKWLERIETHREEAVEERKTHLRKVYGIIHDELGADILLKWCEEFPARFQL